MADYCNHALVPLFRRPAAPVQASRDYSQRDLGRWMICTRCAQIGDLGDGMWRPVRAAAGERLTAAADAWNQALEEAR